MFLNRTRELNFLDTRYARSGAEFVVLYGRRRVRKSALIYEWSHQKPSLYFFCRTPAGCGFIERIFEVGGTSIRPAGTHVR